MVRSAEIQRSVVRLAQTAKPHARRSASGTQIAAQGWARTLSRVR
ncbi:MAG TPA: hypothetical protein VGQ17_13685 [Gemmatimonadales bacterium]|jgi:hypothetical protein|nr:hypothetical protein [Gemmatimonadales bacterium]